MKTNYSIQLWDSKVDIMGREFDEYAILNGREFSQLFGNPMPDTPSFKVEGLLKITNGKKSIYRRYLGSNLVDAASVILSDRSLAGLGITRKNVEDAPPVVKIMPAKWFPYSWNNSFSHIRVPFRCSVLFFAITLIVSIVSILISILL